MEISEQKQYKVDGGKIRIHRHFGKTELPSELVRDGVIQAAREAACITHPQQAVFGRYDLALARSAALIYEQDPVQRQEYASWFDPFRDLTAAKRKQLLDTLEVFLLDAAQSTQQTAQLLGVHANTVQYRLHRVEEKMGLSLLQGPAEPGLILALALRRLERADRSRRQR